MQNISHHLIGTGRAINQLLGLSVIAVVKKFCDGDALNPGTVALYRWMFSH